MHINSKRQPDPQPALDAQPSAQEARPARRRVFDRVSVQRLALACCGVLGTGSLLALAGCPGSLDDPQRFNATVVAAAGSPAGASGAAGTGATVDTSCLTAIFGGSCSTCHFSGAPVSLGAGLDLVSPGVASRLVNVSAMHMGAGGACPAAKLIDTSNPSASWLLTKISGTQGTCGSAMPLGGTMLTSDQIACVSMFATAEAAATGAASTAGGGGATASGSAGTPAAGTSAGSGGM